MFGVDDPATERAVRAYVKLQPCDAYGHARLAMALVRSEDFASPTINAAKFQVVPSDFEGGTGTYTSDTTTNAGRLTIAGNTGSSYWGGQTVQTVDSFDSSKQTTITGVVLGQPGDSQVAAGLAAADAMVDRIAHGERT